VKTPDGDSKEYNSILFLVVPSEWDKRQWAQTEIQNTRTGYPKRF